MRSREIWAIIDVENVVKNTDVTKVLKCYDFESWEVDEMMNLRNDTSKSINEFRWEYVRGTLELTDASFSDIGLMVCDLVDDIKMGYHRISDDLISKDVEKKSEVHNLFCEAKTMEFEYRVFRDYQTCKISRIEIFFCDNDISFDEKLNEFKELSIYLGLDLEPIQSMLIA